MIQPIDWFFQSLESSYLFQINLLKNLFHKSHPLVNNRLTNASLIKSDTNSTTKINFIYINLTNEISFMYMNPNTKYVNLR